MLRMSAGTTVVGSNRPTRVRHGLDNALKRTTVFKSGSGRERHEARGVLAHRERLAEDLNVGAPGLAVLDVRHQLLETDDSIGELRPPIDFVPGAGVEPA